VTDLAILRDLLLLAGASLVVVMLFGRLRLPPVVGFIATGVLIGPGGFGLVRDAELVHSLAEFGVMSLLFTVGLEFSLRDLRRLGPIAFVAGSLQVLLTVVIVGGALLIAGQHPARALFFGMLLSLSSTALVLKILTDRVELSSPHGRVVTAALIFQDLMVLPFAIVVPQLGRWFSGGHPGVETPSPMRTVVSLALVGLMFFAASRLAPRLLRRVSGPRSREAFLFGVVLVVLGSAYLTSIAGLSLALGAFLAGLILAESDLRSQIAADVLPFRDTLASVFFITIGMLLEPKLLIEQPALVLASTVGLVGVKAVVAVFALRWARVPWRVAMAGALTLAQVGEFSFVLAQTGAPSGLLGTLGGQAFYAGAVFSLVLTPWLVSQAPQWALRLQIQRAGRKTAVAEGSDVSEAPHSVLLSGHVVIAGFGLNGHNLARVLRSVRLPHVIVDLDPAGLRAAVEQGSRALVGDITNSLIQGQAGVPRARVLVLALSDPGATRHACQLARQHSRDVFILVRTRYVAEIDELHRLGANQVIPEEFETSIEIFTAVLRHFHVPMNVVQAQIQLLRRERYSLLRGLKLPGSVVEQLETILQQGTCDTFLLLQHSPAIGQTLTEAGLRGEGGPEAVAVVRGGHALTHLDDELRLMVGDILVLTGAHAEMERVFQRLGPPSTAIVTANS
jgi:CPA2 family monovalent cation:H+ antiporter-2